MKKGYVIMSMSVDGATCEDDGFVNCANFGMCGSLILKTKKEAIEVRKQTMDTDLEDFKELWSEEDGYTIEVGDMNTNQELADTYIDVYYKGDVVNETVYKIFEVELPEEKKTIPNEDKAYKNYLLSMLKHNGYYENIRKWMKLKGLTLETVAGMFAIVWDKIPDGMSAYWFLDSIEDLLTGFDDEDEFNQFDDGYDFVDYLYDNDGWKSY